MYTLDVYGVDGIKKARTGVQSRYGPIKNGILNYVRHIGQKQAKP
ncbi:unnamed protein product [marine sediment metagenome]|uniref:Uncharacterized protein n=1 Tax=marine sediment metagenome TaxID=412755 RepID=X1S2P2_9ZZZZ